MAGYDYDLFVIGGGSGGVRGGRMAAATGARVAIAESYRYGGTCVIRGCVPKKLLSYASHFHEDFEDAAGFGWTVPETTFDWATLIANKDKEIDRLEGIYKKLLNTAGVEIYQGHARLLDAHRVEVGEEVFSAETILIATGGTPTFPMEPGWEHGISSNEAFHLEGLPKRVVIAGGGYIAVEFAGIFNGLGSKVTQMYRGPQILRGFDDDVRNTLAGEMVKKGIDIIVETIIDRVEKREKDLLLHLSDGSTLETDLLMAATGRKPNVESLGLETAGVELNERGAIKVDAYSRTTAENIYAVGDVTDRINLTPVAIQEAMAFVDTVYRGAPRAMDHADVPSAVFSHPPVSTVGLTELQAREKYGAVDLYRSTFKPMKHTLSGRDEKTMMKLIVERAGQKVVGIHMVGLDAPEIVQGLAVAIKAGATKQHFDATVGIHPTAAEEFVTMREPLPEAEAKAAE
ncbi:glutathione-disulfide reductase [Pelagibius litoralis]|uniref:Glutathione reductase n=1 Tax=Pelagibius litoralis TaxID=374515 RepID=A0A967KFK1_9PROT|nr:glutathione-disulfide reductase [Pelagibius litoralis]NIA69646.1 glutathione-disulfide reductase [Pelagibius litoralis]